MGCGEVVIVFPVGVSTFGGDAHILVFCTIMWL